MNFLELCQGVGLDSGLVSSRNIMGTVADQTGRQGKIVRFTTQAWQQIQRSRTDWEWMRGDFAGNLVAGQASYTPAELGIATRFARFARDVPQAGDFPHYLYDPALGVGDTMEVREISPEVWESCYGRGEQRQQRPTDYALSGGRFRLGPVPDKAYAIAGKYWKAPQVLAADDDVPELPEHFHDIIKWYAIMLGSRVDGAFGDGLVAQSQYVALHRDLVAEQTRPIRFPGPLA